MTMFNWNPFNTNSVANGWVFGTVLPRLVVNEAYIEVANTQANVNQPPNMVTQYDVNCWVELHNPFASDTGAGKVNNWAATPTAYQGTARLYYPAAANNAAYAGYRLLIAQTVADGNAASTNLSTMVQNNNVLGVPANIKTVVDTYTPDPSVNNLLLNGDSLNQVLPVTINGAGNGGNKITNSAAGGNSGFYVLGPKTAFPGTTGLAGLNNFFATLPVQEQAAATANDPTLNLPNGGANTNSSMHYTFTPANGLNVQNLNHTVVLQRLACPYMPFQPSPTQANFNPYVTVDYMLNVPANNAVTLNPQGQQAQPTPVTQRFSVGRIQPYAADQSQQNNQKVSYDATKLNTALPPPNAPMAQQTPQNTFFCMNVNGQGNITIQYDWPFFANRLLISPGELLNVSGYKPHQLTQMFVQPNPNNGQPPLRFMHKAPWFDPAAYIYRSLEFFEAGLRPQWAPLGGRFPGRININTIWENPTLPDTMMALCDPQPTNFFGPYVAPGSYSPAVLNLYGKMLQTRTPNTVPMPGDRPFRGLAAAYAPAGDSQYGANGCSINDTILRVDPTGIVNPVTNQPKRLFETNPDQTLNPPEMRGDFNTNQTTTNQYMNFEMLTKIWNSTTTRSNVFAVWMTVGFFEVTNPNATPPTLGQEIGRSENRHARHRMFAIIDRTNLTLPLNGALGQPGPRPFFVNSQTAVTQAGAATVSVPCSAGTGNYYEEMTWGITPTMQLLVDPGPNQEVITVTGTAAGGINGAIQVTATFAQPHRAGFAITNALPGNPGPQPTFDPRNPAYSGVVRYFSIIE
jgi:hypothetical protein